VDFSWRISVRPDFSLSLPPFMLNTLHIQLTSESASRAGVYKFMMYKLRQNFSRQKCDMQQIPCWWPTNTGSHSTVFFCHHGSLAPRIFSPLNAK